MIQVSWAGRAVASNQGAFLDFQDIAFHWVASQPWSVGLMVLATGLLYAFHGFRVFRFLLGISAAGLGWAIGYILRVLFELPPGVMEVSLAALLAVMSASRERASVLIICGGSWAVLAYYLAAQMRLPGWLPLTVFLLAGMFGALFAHLSYRPMTVVLTTLQGTVLMIVGFVGASSRLAPSVGLTFRDWADAQSLLVPIILLMLFVTAYSYQSSAQRGDIISRV